MKTTKLFCLLLLLVNLFIVAMKEQLVVHVCNNHTLKEITVTYKKNGLNYALFIKDGKKHFRTKSEKYFEAGVPILIGKLLEEIANLPQCRMSFTKSSQAQEPNTK